MLHISKFNFKAEIACLKKKKKAIVSAAEVRWTEEKVVWGKT